MRILVLCDDTWHPAHVPRNGLKSLENFGFEFDWVEDASEGAVRPMTEYPAVILAKANNISSTDQTPWMSEAVQKAFLDYAQRGNGLLVLHSGTAGYEQAAILRGLMGGVFKEHPPQCLVTLEPLAGHPLVEGSQPFTIIDEHYFMEMADDPVDIFLMARSVHGIQPGGWTRLEGDGRVCVLTPGHNIDVWLHPDYQTLLLKALGWCLRKR